MKNIILGVVGAILVVIIAVLGSLLWQSGQNNGNDKGIINNEKVEISNRQNELNMKNNNQDNGVNKSEQVVGNSAIANQIKLKQFTDKDFGISFKYPKELILEQHKGIADSSKVLKQIRLEQIMDNDSHSKRYAVNIYKNTFSSVRSFKDWHKNNVIGNELLSVDGISVGSNNALQTVEIDGIDSQGTYIYFLNNEHAISFRCDNNDIDKKYLFENILATLKFIK